MLPQLHIRLLGGFDLRLNDQSLDTIRTSRLQSLFAYLVLHRASPQPRAHLAYVLWPDSSEPQAHTNLRKHLHVLRCALPDAGSYLEIDPQFVQWRTNANFTLDVADFETLARQPSAPDRLRAIELYRGPLLPALYCDWVASPRARIQSLFVLVLEQLIDQLEQQGDLPAAIYHAECLISQEPACEAGYQRLIRLHLHNDDRAAAMWAYRRCALALHQELDMEPGPGTRRLVEHAGLANIACSPDTRQRGKDTLT
jgi:DNA-binding SARP family transcriptional activator